MRRDLDTVRDILRYTESSAERGASLTGLSDDIEKLAFHAEMMEGRGLIECRVSRDASGDAYDVEVTAITWEGYDYLDSIRSPKVWSRAKEVISDTVGDTSLSVVKEACKLIATQMIREGLGV